MFSVQASEDARCDEGGESSSGDLSEVQICNPGSDLLSGVEDR